jgi:NADH-quinone oxidoreductase subunit L
MLAELLELPGLWILAATFLPVLAAVLLHIASLVRRLTRPDAAPTRWPGYFAILVMFTSTVLAGVQFTESRDVTINRSWIELGNQPVHLKEITQQQKPQTWRSSFALSFRATTQSLMLFLMVCIISTLVMIYSLAYMEGDDHFGSFYLYLLLFVGSMLVILIANHLVIMFMAWECVGVCSYLLIGYYYEKPSANRASLKAFLMNRIGDAGFLMGMFILWGETGNLTLPEIDKRFAVDESLLMTLAGLGIFAGCVSKSAQFPLHTWLADAMEGPTPVSALIHAATMVAAGVYLASKCNAFFTFYCQLTIFAVGFLTMMIGAILATLQTDIKKILAYSTMSQLGLMMALTDMSEFALFHLITHAFFKALLFLCAGCVIYSMHHEQDVTKMGGLWRRNPLAAGTMLIGVFAMSGVPFTSGWASKDLILELFAFALVEQGTYEWTRYIAPLPFIATILTSYYMMRLWLLVFVGEHRSEEASHASEAPLRMTVPLLILSLFALFLGSSPVFWEAKSSIVYRLLSGGAYSKTSSLAHEIALFGGLACTLTGFGIALFRFFRGTLLPRPTTNPVKRMIAAKFYFDELYDWLFTRPVYRLGGWVARHDKGEGVTVDNALSIPATLAPRVGQSLRRLQSGNIRQYVFALALTLAVVLGILVFR